VDAGGRELPNGETGEIVFAVSKVKNRALKSILLKNPNRRGDYLYTGDLGRFDRDDNLFVVGRKNFLIKVGAQRVMAGEVENVLRAHPGVRETLVFPLRAGETDEAVGAVVVREGRLSAKERPACCTARLDRAERARQFLLRRALSRRPHRKVFAHLFLDRRPRATAARLE